MSAKQKINILWFTKDLRISDNESLFKIAQQKLPFLAVYIFDEDFFAQKQFGFRKIGKYRAKFLLETVQNLEENLNKNNIPLLIKFGKTAEIFSSLKDHFEIEKTFCQEEFTKEELDLQKEVAGVLPETLWEKSYTQLLLEPEFVKKAVPKIPKIFTGFRQKIEKNLEVRGLFDCQNITGKPIDTDFKSDQITLEKLGFSDFEKDERSAFPFHGGETSGRERLENYFFETKNLSTYKETRNGMTGSDYSSKFSAWLANGSLSAVEIYHEVKKYEEEIGSNESTYWLIFELLWREFFKFVAMEYGDRIFNYKGILDKENSHQDEPSKIDRWIEGKTDSDFINANMIEIAEAGFMSNRGRQNVASYFCKTLSQNWLKGAAYFEEQLIDYDVHSNYCNWMYLAGVGNDPRDRHFNPSKQASMYDGDRSFRDLWLKK